MTKVIAINGSPRKNWNTAIMLQSALEGAKANGAETELINLYDYEFKGCVTTWSTLTQRLNISIEMSTSRRISS